MGEVMIKNEQWEYVHRFLVNVSNGYYQHPDNRKMSQLEAKVTLDVITELVHEIERLEGENIKQRDYIDAVNLRTAFRRTSMAVDSHTSPVQPFHMEPE